MLIRLRLQRLQGLPSSRLLGLRGRRGCRLVLVFIFKQLLHAFLCGLWSGWPEDLLLVVVDCHDSSRWTCCQGLGFLVVAFLLQGSIVGPWIPLLRLARLREVVVVGIERRGRVLARLLGVLLPARFAIDAGTGTVICLAVSTQRILLLHFESLRLRCFRR